MTPERWQQVKQALAEVLELAPEERTVYLEERYAADSTMREDLESLIASGERAGEHFLGEPQIAAAARGIDEATSWIGRRIGSYKIIESIGAGGMGEVFRAVRADDQYRKEVAIKVVRAGQFGNTIVARFKNERQILAGLDHPNLARLLDGGTTEDGVPYLVMELIEGRPITEYCDAHDLSVRERLRLFLDVCAGVHYAHQHLVIHRDIKPHNILVTPAGAPKLLDFGIARILETDSAESLADCTFTGFRVLTPRYASPEQIMGNAMTTATDVYSLGVMLYELLTGITPYDATTVSVHDLPRVICECEVQKPSHAIERARRQPQAGPLRQVSAEKLRSQLSGDIDNIVLMAMRKEPLRRYASVNDLHEDIRRHLESIPVIARKDTFWYRANRFVVRHKAAVAATCAVALVLVAGLIVTIRAERAAKRRFDDVRALANSLIFDVHDSVKDLPGSTPARKIIVDRALRYLNVLEQESSGDLGLQRELATAYEKVGAVQGGYLENNLGDFEGTLASYRKALELRKQIKSASSDWHDDIALARAYRLAALQQWAIGDPRGARQSIIGATAMAEAINAKHPNDIDALNELGFAYEVSGRIGYPGDPQSTEKRLDDYKLALGVDEAMLKIEPDNVLAMHGYSTDLGYVGNILESRNPTEARKNYEKGLDVDRRLTQVSTDVRYLRSVAIDYGSIASVDNDIGDYQHSVENNLKDLAIYQQMVAADPKNVLLRQGLAITYLNTADSCSRAPGRMAMALDDSNRALEIIRPQVSAGPKNGFQQSIYATMLVIRGTILTEAKQPEAARAAIVEGRSIYEALFKAGSIGPVNAASASVKLAEAMAGGGHDHEAENEFRRALQILEPLISSSDADLDALYSAADAYSGLGGLRAVAARQRGLTREQRRASWIEARSWYEKSQSTWRRIEHPNHESPNSFHAGDPLVVAKELKAAESALAPLR
jgi:non-specific serine/threonine protein kinase/serine/threonine-protein kinase